MFDSIRPFSSCKRVSISKFLVSRSSPIHVSFFPKETPLLYSPPLPPAPSYLNKYVLNFNCIGKHLYFSSKAVLKGQAMHPEVTHI